MRVCSNKVYTLHKCIFSVSPDAYLSLPGSEEKVKAEEAKTVEKVKAEAAKTVGRGSEENIQWHSVNNSRNTSLPDIHDKPPSVQNKNKTSKT